MSFVKEIRIHTARLGENQQESEPTIKVIKNPHKNTKHVIEYYKWLATDAPIEELRAFADDRYLNDKYPLLMNRYDLYRLETAGLNIEVPEDEIPELIELAQDSFFSGMREDNKVCLNILDIYAIAKTEVRAFRELPDSDTTVLKWFWLYQEDFIDLYNSLGF